MKEKGALVAVTTAMCARCDMANVDKVCTCGVPFCMQCYYRSGHADLVHKENEGHKEAGVAGQ